MSQPKLTHIPQKIPQNRRKIAFLRIEIPQNSADFIA